MTENVCDCKQSVCSFGCVTRHQCLCVTAMSDHLLGRRVSRYVTPCLNGDHFCTAGDDYLMLWVLHKERFRTVFATSPLFLFTHNDTIQYLPSFYIIKPNCAPPMSQFLGRLPSELLMHYELSHRK